MSTKITPYLSLKEIIKKLSKKPGVYIYKNSPGKIIYIGKALSLKNRVSSYFQKTKKDVKTLELVSNIADLQTIQVASEFEALLLEAKLIKQHRPKYNIQSKDGRSYLYIIIGKQYPNRIYSSRKPESEENILDWFGPFPSGRNVEEILRYLRKIFPFRSCNKLPKRVCLYYHMKLCPGVCQISLPTEIVQPNCIPMGLPRGKAPRNDIEINYKKTILQIRQILSGKTKKIISSLEKEMKILSKQEKFEEAQKIKFQYDSLKRLTSGWKNTSNNNIENNNAEKEIIDFLIKYGGINLISLNKIEGYDVSNLGNQIIVGSMVAFSNGELEKNSYRKFNLKGYFDLKKQKYYTDQDDPLGINQILNRRLKHPEWILPQLIIVDGGPTQVSAGFSALQENSLEKQIAIIGLAKKEEKIIVPQIKNNLIVGFKPLILSSNSPALNLLKKIRDESHRFAQNYYKTLSIKTIRSDNIK